MKKSEKTIVDLLKKTFFDRNMRKNDQNIRTYAERGKNML